MVSRPPFPESPSKVPGGAEGFIAGACCRAVLFPRSPVPPDRNDRGGLARDDGGVAAARVVGAVRGHGADLFALGDLVEQFRQDRAVAVPAGGELDGPDVGGCRVHGQMHLAPLAPPLHSMLAGLPFAIAEKLDAGTVHEQVQRPVGTAIRDLNRQGLLPPAQRGVIGNGPVQPRQAQETGNHSGGLPERQLEEHLDRKAELDRRAREDRRAPRSALMRREPGHLLVQPDQQRAALLQRRIVAGPVRRAVAGGFWFRHTDHLTAWIREVNPAWAEFCNNAAYEATGRDRRRPVATGFCQRVWTPPVEQAFSKGGLGGAVEFLRVSGLKLRPSTPRALMAISRVGSKSADRARWRFVDNWFSRPVSVPLSHDLLSEPPPGQIRRGL